MSKRKQKLAGNWKSGRKLIKARHEESASYTEFYVFTVGADGKQADPIAHGLFDAVDQNKVTAMLTQLAQSIGDCEISWARFGDNSMQDDVAWELRDA